jgi:hypothetical protein
MNESYQSMLFVKCSTSSDALSRTTRTSKAEDTFTSCQPGLDHHSSKLSMSICLWPDDWLHNSSGSNGS